jgi:hypothetical protein
MSSGRYELRISRPEGPECNSPGREAGVKLRFESMLGPKDRNDFVAQLRCSLYQGLPNHALTAVAIA